MPQSAPSVIPPWARAQPSWRVVALSAAAALAVAYLDWVTGPDLSLTVFYFIPVGLLAWYRGTASALVGIALCSAIWFFLDYQEEHSFHAFHLYWETLAPIPMFCLFVWITRTCRNLFAQVAELIEAKTAILRQELATRHLAEAARQRLAAEIAAAEQAERRRLALDLHDTLGQDLTALRIILSADESTPAHLPPPPPKFDIARDIVARLIAQIRDLSFDLYPAALDRYGPVAALRTYAAQVAARTGALVSVSETEPLCPLDSQLNIAVFRMVRELIHNAVKHGPAENVLVHFHWRHDALRITVDDDGRGFAPPPDPPAHGLGLRWIHERLASLGGELILESPAGSGARALLRIPLSTPMPAAAQEVA